MAEANSPQVLSPAGKPAGFSFEEAMGTHKASVPPPPVGFTLDEAMGKPSQGFSFEEATGRKIPQASVPPPPVGFTLDDIRTPIQPPGLLDVAKEYSEESQRNPVDVASQVVGNTAQEAKGFASQIPGQITDAGQQIVAGAGAGARKAVQAAVVGQLRSMSNSTEDRLAANASVDKTFNAFNEDSNQVIPPPATLSGKIAGGFTQAGVEAIPAMIATDGLSVAGPAAAEAATIAARTGLEMKAASFVGGAARTAVGAGEFAAQSSLPDAVIQGDPSLPAKAAAQTVAAPAILAQKIASGQPISNEEWANNGVNALFLLYGGMGGVRQFHEYIQGVADRFSTMNPNELGFVPPPAPGPQAQIPVSPVAPPSEPTPLPPVNVPYDPTTPGGAGVPIPPAPPTPQDIVGINQQGIAAADQGNAAPPSVTIPIPPPPPMMTPEDITRVNQEGISQADKGTLPSPRITIPTPAPRFIPPAPVPPPPMIEPPKAPESQPEPQKVPPPPPASESKQNYGTVDAPDRVALGKHFEEQFTAGKAYPTINEARKEAGALLGGDVKPGSPAAKHVDEAVEIGVVRTAREIITKDRSDQTPVGDTYEKLVNLYERQPNLGVRTSTSVSEQAYSTPVPLAFVASELAGITGKTRVYEPTAGNGMLLIGNKQPINRSVANELNPERAAALKRLGEGVSVTQKDASGWAPQKGFDAVIANPPFGKVKENTPGSVKLSNKQFIGPDDQVQTEEIDHAISMRALEAMKDDGKAVLILGSKGADATTELEKRKAYLKDKAFYEWLYQNYNVTDHFTVSGDLYKRQGAGFPVDVIQIEGRKPSNVDNRPWKVAPREYKSYEELKHVLTDAKPANGTVAVPQEQESPGVEPQGSNASGSVRSGGTGQPDESKRGQVPLASGGSTPVDDRTSGPRGTPTSDQSLGGPGPRRPETRTEFGAGDNGTPGDHEPVVDQRPESGGIPETPAPELQRPSDDASRPGNGDSGMGGVSDAEPGRRIAGPNDTEHQVGYEPKSKSVALDTLIPRNLATAFEDAMDAIEAEHGPIDAYVAKELGITPKELSEGWAAEQVDALAMAIDAFHKGSGFIIGDQTGIGKGRVVSGIMRFAIKQGLVPVFITKSPNLYADIYRDLIDTKLSTEAKPFNALPTQPLRGSDKVALPDGRILTTRVGLKKGKKDAQGNEISVDTRPHQEHVSKAVHSFLSGGKLEADGEKYDAIFTTYSQIQATDQSKGEAWRSRLLTTLSPKAYVVMDESHEAGGTGDLDPKKKGFAAPRAAIVRNMIKDAKGVFYSSATYAKRPNVMDLYYKTDIRYAIKDLTQLGELISKGGVPLQQVVSTMLSKSGQYIRREKSFKGINMDIREISADLEKADELTGIFRAINAFDEAKAAAVEKLEDVIVAEGSGFGTDNSTGDAGVKSTSFSSIMHNLVAQMLLSMKIDAVADMVIEQIQTGKKPVVSLVNTMESAYEYLAKDGGTKFGQPLKADFRDVVKKYLNRTREILIKKDKEAERHRLTDEELGRAALQRFEEAMEMIEHSELEKLPISPIDRLLFRLHQAGYRTGEVTGRRSKLVYGQGPDPIYASRPQAESGTAGRLKAINGFNDGDVDVLIHNQAGSTGMSVHSSSKFKDQRPRIGIVAQADPNIDTFTQTLGRINRTGQVNLPRYILVTSSVPAENRPAAILGKKMASLNANVTAARKGVIDFDVPDIMNKVGDEVVAEYMAENHDMYQMMGEPLGEADSDGTLPEAEDVATRLTGKVAVLPIADQKRFWADVVERYNDRIRELDAMNENPLVAKTMDLQAKTLESKSLTTPPDDSTEEAKKSPFGAPSRLEKVSVAIIGKPFSLEEIQAQVAAGLGEGATTQAQQRWVSRTQASIREKVKPRESKLVEDLKKADPNNNALEHKRLERIQNEKENLLNKISTLRIGTHVSVVSNTTNDVYAGIVTNLEQKSGDNPLALSRWELTVALADATRQIKIPLSRIGVDGAYLVNNIGRDDFTDIAGGDAASVFNPSKSVPREERYIATGNLLAASEAAKGNGRITNYTDAKGVLRQGILMPKTFKPDDLVVIKPYADPEEVLEAVESGKTLLTDDKRMMLSKARGEYVFDTAKSKAEGGKYFLNRPILDAAGDREFVSSGNRMRLYTDRDTALAVIEAMHKQGMRFNRPPNDGQPGPGEGWTKHEASHGLGPGGLSGHAKPAFVSQPAATKEGGKLIKAITDDKVGAIGARSIIRFLNDAMGTEMRVGSEQVSKNNPAHYHTGFHLIRTLSGGSDYDFHELGHALSALLGRKNLRGPMLKTRLLELTDPAMYPDTNASAETVEEGLAEWCRLYVMDAGALDAGLTSNMESVLKNHKPDLLKALQDSARAFEAHMQRPGSVRFSAANNDYKNVPHPTFQEQALSIVDSFVFNAMNGNAPLLSRIERPLYKFLGTAEAQKFTEDIQGTPADFHNAAQSRDRAPREAIGALYGRGTRMNKQPQGIRVFFTKGMGEWMTPEQVKDLEDAGFRIPNAVPHGEYIYFTNYHFADVKDAVGSKNWAAFEQYGFAKTSLDRWKKKSHAYAGMSDLTPIDLATIVNDAERANPDWSNQYRRVNHFMDQLLLLDVLSGEHTVQDLLKIKGAYEDYWPMPRVNEQAPRGSGSSGVAPSSGVRRAFGSEAPIKSLHEGVEQRVKQSYGAYYQNRAIRSVWETVQKALKLNVPLEQKSGVARIMTPLAMDVEKMASLNDFERQQVIADHLNKVAANAAGIPVSALANPLKPQDINLMGPGSPPVNVWRNVAPNAVRVVAPYIDGRRQYFQIEDPLLYAWMEHTPRGNESLAKLSNALTHAVQPLKNAITENPVFAFYHGVSRVPQSAIALSKSTPGLIPFYYSLFGAHQQLLGRTAEVTATDDWSKTFEEYADPSRRTFFERFMHQLADGIAVPGWRDMSTGERMAMVPGSMMGTIMKPLNMIMWLGGVHGAVQFSESAARRGAFAEAKRLGKTTEQAQADYEDVGGRFSGRPGSPDVANVFRPASFINPTVQVLYQHFVNMLYHPNPAVRARTWGQVLPAIATLGVVLGLTRFYTMTTDQRRQEANRQEKDKAHFFTLPIPGTNQTAQIPYGYNNEGAALAISQNLTMDLLLKQGPKGQIMAKEALSKAMGIPEMADIITPYGKTMLEAQTNYDFFRGEPIEPAYLLDRYPHNPEMRTQGPMASAYIDAAKVTGVGPLKIQHVVQQIFNKSNTDLLEAIARIRNGSPVAPNGPQDVPIVGRLFARPAEGFASQPVQDIAEANDAYRAAQVEFKNVQAHLGSSEDDARKLDSLGAIMETMRASHSAMTEIERLSGQRQAAIKRGDNQAALDLAKAMTDKARAAQSAAQNQN